MEKHMSAELVKRIEDLAAEMEQFREDPENSAFVDADHLLEFVEVELEDCMVELLDLPIPCLLYTSPSPRDLSTSRMPSSA